MRKRGTAMQVSGKQTYAFSIPYEKPPPQSPRLRGCVRVPAGAVFLASPAPRSLDGRYFGMTPVADITARAMPLLTWSADPLTARDGARAERHADVPLCAPGP